MDYDTLDRLLWVGVTKQAVRDLISGLNRLAAGKEVAVYEYPLNCINTAFSYLFYDEHPVSPDLLGPDVLELVGCVRSIRRRTIERCRQDLSPAALKIFEKALRRLK